MRRVDSLWHRRPPQHQRGELVARQVLLVRGPLTEKGVNHSCVTRNACINLLLTRCLAPSASATSNGAFLVETKEGGGAKEVFEEALFAIGRRPNTAGLAAEAAGVEVDARGFVPVDKYQNTNVSMICVLPLSPPPFFGSSASCLTMGPTKRTIALPRLLARSMAFTRWVT